MSQHSRLRESDTGDVDMRVPAAAVHNWTVCSTRRDHCTACLCDDCDTSAHYSMRSSCTHKHTRKESNRYDALVGRGEGDFVRDHLDLIQAVHRGCGKSAFPHSTVSLWGSRT